MRILSVEVVSDDGVANAAITEAGQRLAELHGDQCKLEFLERAILQHQAEVRYATQGLALSLADDKLYKALAEVKS